MQKVGRQKGMNMKKVIGVAVAILAVMAMTGSALAHTDKSARLQLSSEGTGSEIGWNHGPDSPNDPNDSAINIRTDAGEYASAFNKTWLSGIDSFATSRKASGIVNLSFDFLNSVGNGYVGAGAPRISLVVDTDGDTVWDTIVYLSAFYCQGATSDPTWSRADFTGQFALGCSFYDSNGANYASDGSNSAWDTYVAANPTARIDYGFLVVDEQTANGVTDRSRVDRIAMGRHMQISATKVVHCNTDAAC